MEAPIVRKGACFLTGWERELLEGEAEVFRFYLGGQSPRNPAKGTEEEVLLEWSMPYVDMAGIWSPLCGMNRSIDADYGRFRESMTARSAPVACLFGEDGGNRCTMAVSETRERIGIRAGVREENSMLILQVRFPVCILKKAAPKEGGSYELDVRMDTGRRPFYHAVQAVAKWWEEECGILPVLTPEAAREPVYSTWYAYHQNLFAEEIEEECRLAAELGFRTVILDDGWQTDDNNRGYAFCGDWQVSERRFPDFGEHIRKVHAMGLKYMIWYSVPFLGIHCGKWEEYRDMLLSFDDNPLIRAGVLDPRYKKVRDYLADTYERAVRDWDLDGLKLDFVDCIVEQADSPAYDPEGMDFESVQEALDCLMRTVYERLSAKSGDIMIEFRQGYIGPNMRRYGNMFRVADCPDSAIRNRVGTVDLRLLSGRTAVHSDPLMWHEDEAPEAAAIQIISSIFSTPQISVKMKALTPEMREMLRFWLGFMGENRALLQEQPICALEPHNLYPVVWTQKDGRAITAVYSGNRILRIPEGVADWTVLNGTREERLVLDVGDVAGSVAVTDCYGNPAEGAPGERQGRFLEVRVPVSGTVRWKG